MTSIKQIKQTLETWQHIVDFGYGTIEIPNESKIFKTILNLIETQQEEIERLKNAEEYSKLGKETLLDTIHKQQKEIEKLKENQTAFKEMKEELKPLIKGEYISKDKIRDKIKELEELPNNQYIHLDYIKQEFKKLLEEN